MPELFGVTTANLAFGISLLALLVSLVSAGVSVYVARRDRADVRVTIADRTFTFGGSNEYVVGPVLELTASNRGRRPVTLKSYGLEFSDRSIQEYKPYDSTPLPHTLPESQSYEAYVGLRTVQEDVRQRSARLVAVYFATRDDRWFRMRIWPWSRWYGTFNSAPLVSPLEGEPWLRRPSSHRQQPSL